MAAINVPRLPESPVTAVLLLLAILAVTYALLTVFIRVSVPNRRTRMEGPDSEDGLDARPEASDEFPDPEWTSERVPRASDGEDSESPYGTDVHETAVRPASGYAQEAPEPVPPEPLELEAIRIHGVRVAVGDTASQVMQAFRPGVGETAPLIERLPGGEAGIVVRSYRVGRDHVTLHFERELPGDPLRLTRIDTAQ